MKHKQQPDAVVELFRQAYCAPVLTAFDLPKTRRHHYPYCRFSWQHLGVGVFFYTESGSTEVALSLGPISIGWYYVR
jgi:hypothetical protein